MKITVTHLTDRICDYLRRYGWELMDCPHYRPHTSDLYFFGHLKTHLVGREFVTDADVNQAVTSWLQSLPTDLQYAGIQVLHQKRKKCININGNHVKV